MADVGQVYHQVIDTEGGAPISYGPSIFEDIVSGVGAQRFTKLGVQAPPGTKMVIDNDDKVIMIGKTGIYELQDGISISKLYFIRPRVYIKDEELSKKYREDGKKGMLDADEKRSIAMQQLNIDYPQIPNEFENDGMTINPDYTAFWDRYNNIQATYIKEYNEALNLFNTGSNGIYKQPNENNPNAPENFDGNLLNNVIIDYVYDNNAEKGSVS